MAITLTFGSGGTYADPYLAYNSTPATWSDAYILDQVGACTYSTSITLGSKDQNGFSLTIQGNGDTITCNTNFISVTSANGSAYIQDCTLTTTGYSINITSANNAGANAFELHFRRSKITTSQNRTLYFNSSTFNFGKVNFYANDITTAVAITDFIFMTGFVADSNQNLYVEDNFYTHTGGGTLEIIDSASEAIEDAQSMFFRRNYFISPQAILNDFAYLSSIDGFVDDTYTSSACADISATHDEIPFTTDNFLSITGSDPEYGIPKAGSPVYDDALQTTNIPDNLLGLNGVTVDYRAAGAYTPETQIQPPTGIAYTTEATGIKVTWTPYSPAQAGYEDVGLYYETIPDESAFTTLRATVPKGTNEYTIPYSELTSDFLWYVRLTHRPEA